MLICLKCGKERENGRKLCRNCFLEEKRINFREKYKKNGRWKTVSTCIACKNEFFSSRRNVNFCISCRKLLKNKDKSINNYICASSFFNKTGAQHEHRRIAELYVKRKLNTNEVVHHLDNNPKNNELRNLIIISRSNHGKLHKFLGMQRIIIEKSNKENSDNYWNSVVVPMSMSWLETSGSKIIKLWEICQSTI